MHSKARPPKASRILAPTAVAATLLCALGLGAGAAAAPEGPRSPPPKLILKELRFPVLGPEGGLTTRRVRLGVPAGWTGERDPDGHALRLFGPEGEGTVLFAAVTHPEELGAYLGELKEAHPAAAPSPPEPFSLVGVSPERGERATRFVITGQEVGEMLMIERQGTIVLVATVVSPAAWTSLAPVLQRVYRTLQILDAEAPPRGR
jgi:hypothetical protein